MENKYMYVCFILVKLKLLSLLIYLLENLKNKLFLPMKKELIKQQRKHNIEELNTTVKNIVLYIFIAKQVFLTVILFFTNVLHMMIMV